MKKIISYKRVTASLALFGLVVSSIVSPVGAQQQGGSGLQVTPPRHEVSVQPGTQKTITTSIKNITGSEVIVKVVVNEFEADDETGQPRISADQKDTPTSIRKFLTTTNDIPLAVDETKDVEAVIDVPGDATPGAYYGIIQYQAIPAGASADDGQVSLTASIGTIVLVEVPGEINESMQLLSLKADRDENLSNFFFKAPTHMNLQVRNTGNSFLKPFGRVVVSKGGKEVSSYEVNNTTPRGNVLPGSSRTFRDEISNLGGFGKYEAVANIGFGSGGEVLTIKNSFWIVPLWIVVIAGLILAALVGGIVFFGKKLRGQHGGFKKRR